MKTLSFTKHEFDNFLYPSFVRQGAESENELEIAIRILRKFKDSDVSTPEKIPEDAVKPGQNVVPLYKLNNLTQEFELEEDEFNLLYNRFKASISQFTLGAAEDVFTILNKFKDA